MCPLQTYKDLLLKAALLHNNIGATLQKYLSCNTSSLIMKHYKRSLELRIMATKDPSNNPSKQDEYEMKCYVASLKKQLCAFQQNLPKYITEAQTPQVLENALHYFSEPYTSNENIFDYQSEYDFSLTSAGTLFNMSLLYRQVGNVNTCAEFLLLALDALQMTSSLLLVGSTLHTEILNNLGCCKCNEEDFEMAAEFFSVAVDTFAVVQQRNALCLGESTEVMMSLLKNRAFAEEKSSLLAHLGKLHTLAEAA